VLSVQYHGASTRIEVALDGTHSLVVDRPNDLTGLRPAPGQRVRLHWESAAMQPLVGGGAP
jgi:hypothetical protein